MGGRGKFCGPALACLGLALLGKLSAPDFLGFTVLPLFAAFIFAILAGPRKWRDGALFLIAPGGRSPLRLFAVLSFSLALLLFAGNLKFLPSVNMGAGPVALSPETLELLKKLDRPVAVVVALGQKAPQSPLARELAAQYAKNSGGLISFSFLNPQLDADGLNLAEDENVRVSAENFRETLPRFSEESLNAALSRLLVPERRLIYFLNTFGEKMIGDKSPGGLSRWGDDLAGRRVNALDYYWPEGAPLPGEAAALILAGPKAPLGETRERALLRYIENGGLVMLMADPLTVAISADFWKNFGLEFKEGLVIDPEGNLAGTDETFVLARDYPAHPLTRGLSPARPSLWPLAGAFFAFSDKPDPPIKTYAVAQSSSASWLESDPASLSGGGARYQPKTDAAGPLVLAAASSREGGGRLLALADSDLAVNNFSGFSGNRAFLNAAVHWLLDGESALLRAPEKARELIFTNVSAPLFFWLPVFFWPLFVLAAWAIIIRRQKDR